VKTNEQIAAEWLVIGYLRSWTMQMLGITVLQATGQAVNSFSFLPDSRYWTGKAQVRAFLQQNYPKLSAFLDKTTPEKAIKAAEQIVKLKWNGNRPLGSLTKQERNELSASKKDLRVSTTSYNESRKEFKAHSLHNWNVCK